MTAQGKVPGGDAYDKKYYFDYAFWSHDGFGTDKFVTQTNLFDTIGISNDTILVLGNTLLFRGNLLHIFSCTFFFIGKGLLEDAWQGYNVCLFAYGQVRGFIFL